ncbi:hypothetical protein Acr_16g0001930 [Actinidia rufa]|uniref:Uncharacterized protein n=1 Tax=Actinidia rufa TaxID=165716 RepID=A0A7J0FY02_9ERIC|nr:hypothetical protein Acr_16g0001930 [Actinidia rufa]
MEGVAAGEKKWRTRVKKKKENHTPKRKNRAPKEDGSLPFVSVAVKAAIAEEEDPQLTKNNVSEFESKPQPELGSEIKKAMREREGKDGGGGRDFWSGVAEEIREKVLIQWEAPQPTNRAPVVVWL